ncbi:hypothetical protein [Segatella maculosa]|uniref:Uncharacterized protein n=1 Tax=Segatella maculosa OT 289 TaxID=999422 RepID=H1HP18_9BACT|nr:hypothetical protein [Segatella maculosa]EHO68658.1 hypothetical protein HMPREF9944_01912 [Segatella maculosa OT 289]
MKKILATILVMLFVCSYSYTQNIKQTKVYSFRTISNLDSKGNVIETLNGNGEGVIAFSSAEGKEFMTIVINTTVLYTGEIVKQKRESSSSTMFVNTYLVLYDFHGNKVPLQVFEFFDTSRSSLVPKNFIVNILNAQTAEVIQGQSFENLRRIK